MNRITACLFSIGMFVSSAASAANPPAWVTEGPFIEEQDIAIELPMEVIGNRLYVTVEIGGTPRRFLFDTGSPSLLSADIAAELELAIVDQRQGRDSHGALVVSDIAQADITLGKTTIKKVPIFVTELPETARCLFDGVLGSEVLPLCTWQVDANGKILRCNSDTARLPHVNDSESMPLHDFGYPHTPILDFRFAEEARSKAFFDTGSPEYLVMSPQDFDAARRNDAVSSTRTGGGSIGGSIGGAAPDKDQLMLRLAELEIGGLELGEVDSLLRTSAPSLIGAGLLENFVITLDTRRATAYFDRIDDQPFTRSGFGFGMNLEGDARISLVWSGSPAADAGLEVGERVLAINGEALEPGCPGIRRAVAAMSGSDSITIKTENGEQAVTRSRSLLD